MRSTVPLLVALALSLAGCLHVAGDGPIVIVTASYPGANAQAVADTVAVPIEQQINGVEGMVRMESECRNDGTYLARVRFKPNTNPDLALVLLQNRVALAKPVLPGAVQQAGVAVNVKAAEEGDKNRVTIALLDHHDLGREALRGFSAAVLKRITAEKAVLEVEAFPGAGKKQVQVSIDRAKCAERGIPLNEVVKAVEAAGRDARFEASGVETLAIDTSNIETYKKLRVKSSKGDEVSLDTLATIELVDGPAAVFRVDMYPAVRITGTPPEGKTRESAAAQCVELADAERKSQEHPDGLAVWNLTGW